MRICDLTTLFIDGGEGGVNTYLAAKARDFADRRDVRHVIVVPGAADRTYALHASTVHVLRSPRLPWNPSHRVLFRVRDVARRLRAENPSLVEVDCASFLGDAAKRALAGRRVPIVGYYHVHLPAFIARPAFARFGGAIASAAEGLAWRYARRCCRPCDRVLVPSEDIRARLERRGFGPIETVPLGVDLDLFRPEPRARRARAARPVVILAVSRLSHEKDLAVLIEAFRRLSPPERYRLEIVGTGPLRRGLEALSAGDARIAFRGACRHGEELARAYAGADVFVNSSPNETFGLTLLEAMASGLPVVAMRRGGPAHLVTREVGELATPGDAGELAAAIARAAARPEEAGRAGRSYVERCFSWRRTFDRLVDVYEDVLTAGGESARADAARAALPVGAPGRGL